MLTITFDVSNDGADTAVRQLNKYLDYANAEMAGEVEDPEQDGSLGYVIIRKVRDAVVTARKEQAALVAGRGPRTTPPRTPSVREERRGA